MNKKWSIPAALACTSIVALGATARATPPTAPSAPNVRPAADFPFSADAAEHWARSWIAGCVDTEIATLALPITADTAEQSLADARASLEQECTARLNGAASTATPRSLTVR